MKFKNELAYGIGNANKFGLIKNSAENITLSDFTFCAKVKVDWHKMKKKNHTETAGIICKSGMHLGLMINKTDDNKYLKAMAWVDNEGTYTPAEILMYIDDEEEILNLSFIHNLDTKTITLVKNGKSDSVTYTGKLIEEYKDSWIWIGCANAFEPCDPIHRNFFNGDINFIGIFNQALPIDIIDELFSQEKLNNPFEYGTIVYTNLKEKTQYKIKDMSGNGNNLLKYSRNYF
jgi:hypothetical protein